MAQKIFVIAGPNGAGKTTTAISLIPDLLMIIEDVKSWEEIQRVANDQKK